MWLWRTANPCHGWKRKCCAFRDVFGGAPIYLRSHWIVWVCARRTQPLEHPHCHRRHHRSQGRHESRWTLRPLQSQWNGGTVPRGGSAAAVVVEAAVEGGASTGRIPMSSSLLLFLPPPFRSFLGGNPSCLFSYHRKSDLSQWATKEPGKRAV